MYIYIYIFYVCKSIYIYTYLVFSSKLEKDDCKVPIFFPAPGISRPPEELGLEQPLPENQKMGSEFCLPGFVCVCVGDLAWVDPNCLSEYVRSFVWYLIKYFVQ